MNRAQAISNIQSQKSWDCLVIGGGATGLGIAIDGASRGYSTLLLEKYDFGKGTSSRSTKLIHGGIRYLQQGNIPLVLEALRERGLLCKNASHIVKPQPFILPVYKHWELYFYQIGLKIYDLLAGKHGLPPSKRLSKDETIQRLPTLNAKGLVGGILYYDSQFDDTRLAINLAQTIFEQGGTAINYAGVTSFIKEDNVIVGVQVHDSINRSDFEIKARSVINATGVFADSIRSLDDPNATPIISASQGIHIVLPKSYMPHGDALIIPKTSDGRVLFAIPWHDKVLAGTTDTPVKEIQIEPKALEEELGFLFNNLSAALNCPLDKKDILSVFTGLRPLVQNPKASSTSEISREHTILSSPSKLITIAGGKWTTYRKMAEDVVNYMERINNDTHRPCITENLSIHGNQQQPTSESKFSLYGSDAKAINTLIQEDTALSETISPNLPYTKSEVLWSIHNEMAETIEDILARRTRSLYLNANESLTCAKLIGNLMQQELGWSQVKKNLQIENYSILVKNYYSYNNSEKIQ